jgi:hypothetical protein
MNALEPTGRQADHLDLMKEYLDQERDNPGLAVCRYIKSILPRMDCQDVMKMSGCLIGSTAGLIVHALRDDPADLKRLAALIVACILPAGADLGMESQR